MDALYDTRTEAAAWIAAQIPAGATLGMKCMEGGRKAYDHAHFDEFMWDFPRIDPRRYRLTDCLDRPEYLVLSEFTNKEVITAYTSGLMQGDAWPADEYGLWWRQKIPPPPLMALYRALLFGEGDGYVLVRYFPGAGIEARNFDLSYRLTRLKVVDWRLIGRIFANPWRFLALEYPAPEIRIYRQRGAAAS
ncbi:MAG: hypothetical protein HY543_06005 [Deltaproteobacteria bacterium]|nr:hypothetical protein [Deltaproteobacteria bacterium]